MKNLSELVGETLTMVQPSIWKSFYELRHDDEVIGTIRSSKFFGLNMIFKMNNKEWEIYYPSLWKSEIAIREQGYEIPFAKYLRDGLKNKGSIYLPKGMQLKITFKLFIGSYRIETLSGDCLVSFEDRISFKEKTKIFIEQKSELLDKNPWVIAVALYISLRRKRTAIAVIG